jgi:L-asparaginase
LLREIPALAGQALSVEQVAQCDSKDMDHAIWQQLAQRVAHHLARPEVTGIVITHGTDTLEETAWFLQRVLAPSKPVVLTAAMRPATALHRDGPQNLLDAVTAARSSEPQLAGVLAVVAGAIHSAQAVSKRHPYRVDAFSSGEAGVLGWVEEGEVRLARPGLPFDEVEPLGLALIDRPVVDWPWVAVVTSHAGADATLVRALVGAGVRGIVVAGTGNGTVHQQLQTALHDAQIAGVRVWRCSRCVDGAVVGQPAGALASAGALSPVKARIALMLALMAQN